MKLRGESCPQHSLLSPSWDLCARVDPVLATPSGKKPVDKIKTYYTSDTPNVEKKAQLIRPHIPYGLRDEHKDLSSVHPMRAEKVRATFP